MPAAIFILIACQLLGESLRLLLALPIPGPVIGMFLLAGALAVRDRAIPATPAPAPTQLDRAASNLLLYMGLLFVPAGVGVITELNLLQREWLPIIGGLVGSSVLGLVVTGLVMHRLSRATAAAGSVAQ